MNVIFLSSCLVIHEIALALVSYAKNKKDAHAHENTLPKGDDDIIGYIATSL